MAVFEYSALDASGKKVSGIIDADSAAAARQKLRAARIFPVSVHEARAGEVKPERQPFSFGRRRRRIRPAEAAMLTRQLATLLGAGFPLVPALDTLLSQGRSHTFNRILAQIKDSVVAGSSFAAALARYPGTFSTLFINMVRAGETSGTLEIVLDRLAEIGEKQEELKNRIRSAMTYPLLMLAVGLLVLFFLLTYIVPSITAIFSDMNQVLPAPTRFLIRLSALVQSGWWLLLLFVVGLVVLVRMLGKTAKGRFLIDRTLLRLPAVGALVRKMAVARFSRTLGSLLENGVVLLSALEIVKNVVGNVLLADAVAAAAREVGKGQGLGNALAASRVFPDLPIQMISVGEQSGQLEAMLYKVADVYENEVQATILRMTSLLEPVMILMMGIVVGFIVLAICLPIFEMNTLIR
ncbi:MAG: type II secretion system inner membrane protein GspF [Desulfobacteraceae bacterium]|jgi:general secretion pathway protein F|nr:type II secretion system inner membrane protein GspF [Desulfobacteraceae bacterium]